MGNKGGKAKKWKKISTVLGILVLFAAVFTGYQYAVGGEGGDETDIENTEFSGTTDCNTAPTLSYSVRNAFEQGTSVTTGAHYFVNDVYMGTSAPSSYQPGDKVQLILNATGYIDVLSDEIVMECGSNKLTKDGSEAILMYDYTAPTVEIKLDNTVLTDSASGGANNATAISAGGSDTYSVCFTGTDKDSTGDFVYTIELGNTQNVSTVSMYNANTDIASYDVPGFYTDTLTSPYKKAFKVPAIEGAKEVCYDMTVVAKSGKIISGAVYTTAYVGEPLVEDDGSVVKYGVEQSDGDSDYEATFDEDFYMV